MHVMCSIMSMIRLGDQIEEYRMGMLLPSPLIFISLCEFELLSDVLSFQPEGLSLVFLVRQIC